MMTDTEDSAKATTITKTSQKNFKSFPKTSSSPFGKKKKGQYYPKVDKFKAGNIKNYYNLNKIVVGNAQHLYHRKQEEVLIIN